MIMNTSRLFSVRVFVLVLFMLAFSSSRPLRAQTPAGPPFPVRGLEIAAPEPADLDRFLQFIRKDLKALGVNTLVLRVDYGYKYKSYPELADENALTKQEAKKIAKACQEAGIRLIPSINMLGHQSWHEKVNPLLEHFPQFDETPGIQMPEKYVWPNPDRLYCKSYCPLHPDVHKVVFALMDELLDAFEADAFHAGMDEVFYIASPDCPRCAGRDPAALFAGEVRRIHDHLAGGGKEMWIWGDRLLDGKTTGLGMWEASMNNTYRAVDMIPKDVVICDWHYEKPVPTPPYFAMKGFRVISCPYRKAEVAVAQAKNMITYRQQSPEVMQKRFLGVMQTVWTSAGDFMDAWYGTGEPGESTKDQVACMRALFSEIAGDRP